MVVLTAVRGFSVFLGQYWAMDDFIEPATLRKFMEKIHNRKSRSLMKRFREIENRRKALSQYVSGSGFESDAGLFRQVFEVAGIDPLSAASKNLALSAGLHIEAAWATKPARDSRGSWVALNPFAVFTLLRASLEHSALGLWALRPDDSGERVRNYSGLLLYSQSRYWTALNSHRKSGQPVVNEPITEGKLREILNDGGIDPECKPSSTNLLKTATEFDSPDSLVWSPLVSWQVASGIAHGIPWASEEVHNSRIDLNSNNSVISLDSESFNHVLAASLELFDAFVSRIEVLNARVAH